MTITKKTRLLPPPFIGTRIMIRLDDPESLTWGDEKPYACRGARKGDHQLVMGGTLALVQRIGVSPPRRKKDEKPPRLFAIQQKETGGSLAF